LINDKKIDLMINGWRIAAEMSLVPLNARLFIIGEGPEMESLRALAHNYKATKDRVIFTGAITDINVLRQMYRTALATCSTGYIGLAAIQSICFGVPIIVADREPHSPEIEACQENRTALFFRAGDPQDLAHKFSKMFE